MGLTTHNPKPVKAKTVMLHANAHPGCVDYLAAVHESEDDPKRTTVIGPIASMITMAR
jgi:hypothetical protein